MSVRRPQARRSLSTLKVAAALALVGAIAVVALAGMLGTFTSGALMALPALLLAVALLGGSYPGERLLRSWGRGRSRPRIRGGLPPALPRPAAAMPRGGSLIASALAGRAPPLASAG
jgi:hypothetical protein